MVMGDKPESAPAKSSKPKRVGVVLPVTGRVDVTYVAGVRFAAGEVVMLDKADADAALAESKILVRAGKDA